MATRHKIDRLRRLAQLDPRNRANPPLTPHYAADALILPFGINFKLDLHDVLQTLHCPSQQGFLLSALDLISLLDRQQEFDDRIFVKQSAERI